MHPDGVRAARALHAESGPDPQPVTDLRTGLGLRLRVRVALARRLRRVPASEDRGRWEATPDPYSSRPWLHPPRGVTGAEYPSADRPGARSTSANSRASRSGVIPSHAATWSRNVPSITSAEFEHGAP